MLDVTKVKALNALKVLLDVTTVPYFKDVTTVKGFKFLKEKPPPFSPTPNKPTLLHDLYKHQRGAIFDKHMVGTATLTQRVRGSII